MLIAAVPAYAAMVALSPEYSTPRKLPRSRQQPETYPIGRGSVHALSADLHEHNADESEQMDMDQVHQRMNRLRRMLREARTAASTNGAAEAFQRQIDQHTAALADLDLVHRRLLRKARANAIRQSRAAATAFREFKVQQACRSDDTLGEHDRRA